MTKIELVKKTTLALAISLTLIACVDDGKDGVDGVQGEAGIDGGAGPVGNDGADGADGLNGQDANTGISLSLVGRIQLNDDDPEGAAEIVQYHAATNTIYAINGAADAPTVELIDASSLTSEAVFEPLTANNMTSTVLVLPTTQGDVNLDSPTSVAVRGDLMAVAVPANDLDINGFVLFYNGLDSNSPAFMKAVEVGNLPDMVTFTPDGSKVLTANEGEPSGDYTIDPEGSISIIAITDNTPADTATHINFSAFNGQQASLEAMGMHFPNPSGRTINGTLITTTVAQDLEPEYISATDDFAYVALQENNGLAVIDLSDNSLQIIGLGFKNWGEYLLDGMEDGGVSFGQYQDVYGMYQPDTIASYTWKDATFIITANEGDAREYFFDTLNGDGVQDEELCEAAGGMGFDEEDGCLSYSDETQARRLDYVADSNLDTIAGDDPEDFDFTTYPLGRLNVTHELGDTDNDGEYEGIYAYGARSFTIWDQNGLVVFDSGDDFERITASIYGDLFNNNNDENGGDTRSANKGPEPEALAVGQVGEKTYAFIGLERMGGIMVYDITNPYSASFVDYVNNRDLTEGGDLVGDSAPEGMAFVAADDSPTGYALLVIGNEVSGTVSVWQIAKN